MRKTLLRTLLNKKSTTLFCFEFINIKRPKTKNLRESLKQLNKQARAIRKETAKKSGTLKQRTKSELRKRPQDTFQQTQGYDEESQKSASAKKPSRESVAQKVPEKEQTKAKSKKIAEQPRQEVTEKPTRKATTPYDVDEDEDYQPRQTKHEKKFEPRVQEPQEKKVFNASEGVKNLMKDPASAFENAPTQTKLVTFKEAPQFRESLKFKETPAPEQRIERPKTAQIEFKKVEELPTLLKELQKNEKLREKINEDMGGTLDVNPM